MNNTGVLIAADQIVDAVQNFFDWQMLYSSAKSFAVMNNIGMVGSKAGVPDGQGTGSGGKGNYRVLYNKVTGVKTDYITTGAITPAAGAINLMTVGTTTSQLDISAALTLINVKQRAGLAFRINGSVVTSTPATVTFSALFRLETVTTEDSNLLCRLISSSLSGVAAAAACTSIVTGSNFLITELANFSDGAPESDDITTAQYENYIQMFDSAYGKDLVALSQQTKYDNSINGLRRAVEPAFYSKIETALWYGGGFAPTATYNYGEMKGIWKLLNLSDPTLNTDEAKPQVKVESSATFNYWTLYDMLADRPAGAPETMIGFTSSKFGGMIEREALAMNKTVDVETVRFPRMSYKMRTIEVGDTQIRLVTTDKLKYHPSMVDSVTDTLIAKQEHVLVCLDPNNAGIDYHDNAKFGTMIPKVRALDPIRDKRVEEAHILAALTFGVTNMQNHLAYGITG